MLVEIPFTSTFRIKNGIGIDHCMEGLAMLYMHTMKRKRNEM